jgi:predicted nucleotidyltransferase
MAPAQAALSELTAFFQAHFGTRLDKVILFGSYARGDFHEESDLDLLVVLDEMQASSSKERRAMESKLGQCYLAHSLLPSVFFSSSFDYAHSNRLFIKNIRAEGFTLYERAPEYLSA